MRPGEWLGGYRGLSRSAGAARGCAAHGRESVRLRGHQPPGAMTVQNFVDRERKRLRGLHVAAGIALSLAVPLAGLSLGVLLLGHARWISLPGFVPLALWLMIVVLDVA